MTRGKSPESFESRLLNRDLGSVEVPYQEHRAKLEKSLETAERRERQVAVVAASAFAVGLGLMFVGGSRIVGSFDPWSDDATPLSIVLGIIYVIACLLFPLALAAGLTRFRTRVQTLKQQLRDTFLLDLSREVRELRDQVAALARKEGSKSEPADPGPGLD